MSPTCVELDGSEGEGGGQILRSSLALSLLTGRPFHLRNVRARRERPGLQPQHLMSVRAAARVGNAGLRGAELRSRDLLFEPGEVAGGDYEFMIGTAGATGLVLQTIYLPLALAGAAPSRIVLGGGTHNPASPCYHFLDVTWRRYLEVLGIKVALTMERPGFYPRGGGVVVARIEPCAGAQGLQLVERTQPRACGGFSAGAGLPEHVAQRQARQAEARLRAGGVEVELEQQRWQDGPGSVLALSLPTQPAPTLFFGLGARGKPAERVADEAVDQVLAYLNAAEGAVDPHSADQLVLPLAFARSPSFYTVTEVTSHLLTNIGVIRRFVEREIECQGHVGQPGAVRIN